MLNRAVLQDFWSRHFAWDSEPILREQVALVWRNLPVALIASLCTSVGQLWFMWPHVAHAACLAWFGWKLLLLALMYGTQQVATRRLNLVGQAHSQIICLALLGLGWGSSITVAAAYGTDLAMVYALIVVGGVNSGALGICGALMPAAVAYLLAMSGTLLLGVFVFADPSFAPLSILVVIYVIMSLIQASNAQQAAKRSIVMKLQNVDLVDQLRHESQQAMAAFEQARSAQQAAETANQDKSKFLAAASHDLRQPLHAMGLFLEALDGSDLSKDQRKILTHLRSASDSTSEMLNTLLDYSRLEAGAVQVKARSFSLSRTLLDLEREFGLQARAKGLQYRNRKTTLATYADPSLVDLVLRNLISNAIRYTSRGGVLVACRRRGSSLVVQVWDTGLGIEQEEQQAVFKEFHQLGNPERDRQKGLGLGLAIVKRLCEAMDAQIHLRSVHGQGSVFELVLPLYQGVLKGDAIEAPAANLSGLRLMVIDDEAAVREGMQSLLSSWGCKCDSFESAQEALDALAQWSDAQLPHVLISDYRLRRGLTGAQAIAQVREAMLARGQHSKLPAIIITGDTAPDRIREAQATDAVLLHKPVSAIALAKALTQMDPRVKAAQ
ncbi:MAG: response regulator [Burkholderiales bacterium]|nr:MAG: response regulator [Burkholderiales bacterium]